MQLGGFTHTLAVPACAGTVWSEPVAMPLLQTEVLTGMLMLLLQDADILGQCSCRYERSQCCQGVWHDWHGSSCSFNVQAAVVTGGSFLSPCGMQTCTAHFGTGVVASRPGNTSRCIPKDSSTMDIALLMCNKTHQHVIGPSAQHYNEYCHRAL